MNVCLPKYEFEERIVKCKKHIEAGYALHKMAIEAVEWMRNWIQEHKDIVIEKIGNLL